MNTASPHSANDLSWINPSLTVLVPTFNEEKNLVNTLERLIRALNISVEDFEIIIVNDGSSDNTGAIANQLAEKYQFVRVLHNPGNKGLGYSYARGIEMANKQLFVYIPGDNTWPYRSLLELFGSIGKADIVTSYSSNPQVRTRARRIISAGYTRGLNLLFGYRMHYYNGLTIYPAAFLKKTPVKTTGFGFQAEILLKALHASYSFIEVPLPIDERTSGSSKAVTLKNIISVILTILRLIFDLRLRYWLGAPGNLSNPRQRNTKMVKTSSNVMPEELGLSIEEDPKNNTQVTQPKITRLRVILTGASSGIGAALLEALVSDGHTVFACARRSEQLDKLTNNNQEAFGWPCDVSDEVQVLEFISKVKSKTPYVDALINCAGGFGAIGPIDQTDSNEWLETIQVNLFGTYLLCKHSLPLLSGASAPQIINMSGGGAFSPFPNYSAYATSKAGVVRFTESLALELSSRGIMVNAVAPGFVITNIHDATLEAGEKLAGRLQYHRTKALIEEGGVPLSNVINCIRYLLSGELLGLTGKTISANFDPWQTLTFKQYVQDISRSDLYSLRRFNLINLPDGTLKRVLRSSWASYGSNQ